jgi:hypothetical protein
MRYPVQIKYKGFYLLQFENTTFENGRIWWDYCEVTPDKIKQILSFETPPFL